MSKSSAQAAQAAPQFDKFFKETTELGSQYSEAYSKSSAIYMKGFEDLMSTMVSLAQNSAEKQSKYIKEAMSVKTINEFAEVQNKIAQANFDDFMTSATKISEISVKVLTESAEPVSAQVSKTIQKATESVAA